MATERGIYEERDVEVGHIHSKSLCDGLSRILDRNLTVIDFGCGTGKYIDELGSLGFNTIGLDGINKDNHPNILVVDLSTPLELGMVGNVVSLEVGEHIPKEFEDVFIDNLIRHCGEILILSWAIENQIGIGHINCQNNDYIISKFESLNFKFDEKTSKKLRSNIEDHCDYFRNTLMVFRKNG